MIAAVCTAYGPPEVLRLVNLDRPVPGDDEILIKEA
jgi:NADPH:quinone reductase-like Zn-dependent oxidoreductase